MRSLTLLCYLLLTTLTVWFSIASATSEVNFSSTSRVVTEDQGTIWIEVVRTGDLSNVSTVIFQEMWSDSNTTLNENELLYNHYVNDDVYTYVNSSRWGIVTFYAGQAAAVIAMSISNDQEAEENERLYLELNFVSTGTTIGNSNRMYIEVQDNDSGPVPFVGVYGGTITDEGNTTKSFLVLSEPTDHAVTLRVSTYYDTYKEANYPVQNDYTGLNSSLVTIPAGSDFTWVPITTHQNNDPNDSTYEDFELCIDDGSVSGAIINVSCAKLIIKDIPLSSPTIISSDIFKDSLGSGWWDSSWGVSSNTQAESHSGTYGLEVNFTYEWSGLSFSSDGFDTTNYDTLSFALKSSVSNSAEEMLVVAYRTDNSTQTLSLSNYVTNNTLVPDEWNVVHIPLTDLGVENTLVNRIVFENGVIDSLIIDELSFLTYTGECE